MPTLKKILRPILTQQPSPRGGPLRYDREVQHKDGAEIAPHRQDWYPAHFTPNPEKSPVTQVSQQPNEYFST